jgi:hypothetical protein
MSALRARVPHLVAFLSAVVILGPALLPGLVLTYDIAWSPDPRLTPAVLGLDTPAPRVVPSDVVVVLLAKVITPEIAPKLVLLALLVVASLGALRLLTTVLDRAPSRVAALGAVLLAQWNPFVAERLALGQWTILWGYALLPWAWAAALRARAGGGSLPVAGTLALSALGGGNSMLIVGLALLPTLLWPPVPRRALVVAVATALGGSAAWSFPALVAGTPGDDAGVAAFAARSDSPLGLVGSLLSGGGVWNVSAWPTERASWVLAIGALLLLLTGAAGVLAHRRAAWVAPLALGAVPWLVLAVVSGWGPLRGAWEALLAVPGGGLLRDAHKLVAPWVVLCALGLAVLGDRWARAEAPGRTALAWLVALVGVPLLLSATFGMSGQLRAVSVPADVRAAARTLSDAPPGTVGLLPWNQYRRYAWNDDRISLSVIPRLVDQPVLQDDSLPLRDRRVAGERADSAAVSAAIARGVSPTSALRSQGVRYLVIERRAIPPAPRVPSDGRVLAAGPHVVVVEVNRDARSPETGWTAVRVVGWAVSVLTCVAVLVGALRSATQRRRAKRV